MIVVVDSSVLVYLFDVSASAPIDPKTRAPVEKCRDRVDHLISSLSKSNTKLIIPTPVLAEVLVNANKAGPEWVSLLERDRNIRIVSFDTLAAIECSELAKNRNQIRNIGHKRNKAKFDEQIVAIAKVVQAEKIYSDDRDIKALIGDDIEVIGILDLPLPEADPQGSLPGLDN